MMLTGDSKANVLNGSPDDDVLNGGAGNDTINGDGGNDLLRGGSDDDIVDGGDGNDALSGGAGLDILTGGIGDDRFMVAGADSRDDVFDGGSGNDAIVVTGTDTVALYSFDATFASIEIWRGNNQGVIGSALDDVLDFSGLTAITGLAFISGAGGNDTITGTDFADNLRGGAGTDVIEGGEGNDTLFGGADYDTLRGGKGDDTLRGEGAGATLDGGEGNDKFMIAVADAPHDEFVGGAGDDTIVVTGTLAVTFDSFDATEASVEIFRGNAHDVLGNENDNVLDFSGIAVVSGLRAVNSMGGDDAVTGTKFADFLRGAAGDDKLQAGEGNDKLYGDAGHDELHGGGGNDRLEGGADADDIDAGADNDQLVVAGTDAQFDLLDGGTGVDTLAVIGTAALTLDAFDAAFSAIEIWQGNGKAVLGNADGNTLDFSGLTKVSGIASIDGAGGDDTITGSNFRDDLRGGLGADTIAGGLGADVVSLGSADGASDVLRYLALADKGDTVKNFVSTQDKIVLVASGFTGAVVDEVNFFSGSNPLPLTAEGTLLYDTDDGKLYWDADGTGADVRQQLLTLAGHPMLAAGDFMIV